jgi:hypothetical protein
VEALKRVTATFKEWNPGMEGTVDDIWIKVGKLSKHWERVVHERSLPLLPTVSSSSTPPSSVPQVYAYALPQPSGDPKSSSTPEHPLLQARSTGPMSTASTTITGRVAMGRSRP